MTRRDKCYFVGKRARTCDIPQSVAAWAYLATELEALGDRDLPKFRGLLRLIRSATIAGKMIKRSPHELKPLTTNH